MCEPSVVLTVAVTTVLLSLVVRLPSKSRSSTTGWVDMVSPVMVLFASVVITRLLAAACVTLNPAESALVSEPAVNWSW